MLKLGFHGRSAVCPKPQRVAKLDRLKKIRTMLACPALGVETTRAPQGPAAKTILKTRPKNRNWVAAIKRKRRSAAKPQPKNSSIRSLGIQEFFPMVLGFLASS
ncbi:MAG TPA: hypothetical protein VFC17_09660 [Candidatus Limnocylindrales bacterium]|nr:hypothetical protein [Candidatus Limnocylindrales bacterium]